MSDDDAMNEDTVEQQQRQDEAKDTDSSTPSTNNTTTTHPNDNSDNDATNHVHPSSTTYLAIGDAFADLEPNGTLQQIAATNNLPAPWAELKQTIQAAILKVHTHPFPTVAWWKLILSNPTKKQCDIMHPRATDPAVQHNIETIRTNILHNLDRHNR